MTYRVVNVITEEVAVITGSENLTKLEICKRMCDKLNLKDEGWIVTQYEIVYDGHKQQDHNQDS